MRLNMICVCYFIIRVYFTDIVCWACVVKLLLTHLCLVVSGFPFPFKHSITKQNTVFDDALKSVYVHENDNIFSFAEEKK